MMSTMKMMVVIVQVVRTTMVYMRYSNDDEGIAGDIIALSAENYDDNGDPKHKFRQSKANAEKITKLFS